MFKLTIRRRLLMTFTLVILVGGLALFWLAGRQLSRATLEFYQHDLETEAVTLTSGLAEALGESGDEGGGGSSLQLLLQRSQTDTDKQYTVLDASGRVLASTTTITPPTGSSEIRAALRGRTEHRIEGGSAFIATPIEYEGEVRGVLVLSAPMAPAYDNVRRAWFELAAATLPILLLSIVASWWLGQVLSRPIQQLHASVLRIAEGNLNEHVTVKTNDEIGELGQAFNFMSEKLHLLLTAQRNFVSNAAHELRTPLMTLKLRAEALLDDTLPPDERQTYLREVGQEVEHMANLVSNLLTLARLDEGRHQTQQDDFDLAALLRDTSRQWRIQASLAEIDFETAIPDALPKAAVSVSDLRMILDNLLGNALKYTPAGGRVRLLVSAGPQTIRFDLSDTGAGFVPEEADRLFERFYRTDTARSRQIPGTGLGLSIAQALIKQNGGTITAASDGPGQGSTFTVILPASA